MNSAATRAAGATAANTRRIYRSRLALFAAWCAARGERAVPARPEVLRAYLVALSDEDKAFSTIKLSRAAIVSAHRELGHEPPDSEELRATLEELRQSLEPRGGMGSGTLMAIVSACAHDALAARDRALLLVTYFAGLRRSQSVALDREGVLRDVGGYRLLIPERERRSMRVRLPIEQDAALCPVRALDAWLAQRDEIARAAGQSPGRGPLFFALRGGRRRPVIAGRRISPEDVGRILKRRAGAAGIDAASVCAQDLCAGVSSEAARGGGIRGVRRHGVMAPRRREVRR